MASIPLLMNTTQDCKGPRVPIFRKYKTVKVQGLNEGDTIHIDFGTYGNGVNHFLSIAGDGEIPLQDYEIKPEMYAQARIEGGKGSQAYVWLE